VEKQPFLNSARIAFRTILRTASREVVKIESFFASTTNAGKCLCGNYDKCMKLPAWQERQMDETASLAFMTIA